MTNPTSRWDPQRYATTGSFVPALTDAIVSSIALVPGERVLDVGCGDGVLTQRLRDAGADVVGVDASPELARQAAARGLDVRVTDAADMTFDAEFDVVFSNAALHWMLQPDPVARAMYAALRPGGRLVVEFGGFGNIAAIRSALRAVLMTRGITELPEDQYYPTPADYASVLDAAGFIDVRTELVPRPTLLADGMAAWLATFRGGFFDVLGLDDQERTDVIDTVVDVLRPALCTPVGQWWADYVRIRAWGRRP